MHFGRIRLVIQIVTTKALYFIRKLYLTYNSYDDGCTHTAACTPQISQKLICSKQTFIEYFGFLIFLAFYLKDFVVGNLQCTSKQTFKKDFYFFNLNLQIKKSPGLTGFDSIVLCKYKHVARCVISALI